MKDNAIYHLARALDGLANFDFDFHLTDITREYFRQAVKVESGALAADMTKVAYSDREAMKRVASASPPLNAMMRTTCVATLLEGGHANNALQELAAANINCRLLPDDSVDRVVAELTKLVADDQVKITITTNEGASPASPLRPEIIKAFARVTDTLWPGVITVPIMGVGASDGRRLRLAGIPTYGSRASFRTVMMCARTDATSECSCARSTRGRHSCTNSSRLCRTGGVRTSFTFVDLGFVVCRGSSFAD